jgi:hypothetical protein
LCAAFHSEALANRQGVVREEGSGGFEGKLWNGAKANRAWLVWWATLQQKRIPNKWNNQISYDGRIHREVVKVTLGDLAVPAQR